MAEDEKQPEESTEDVAPEAPEAPEAEAPAEEEPAAEEVAAPEAEAPAEEEPAAEEVAAPEAEKDRRPRGKKPEKAEAAPEVVPGAHLEPDLVLDQPRDENEFGQYQDEDQPEGEEGAAAAGDETPTPVAATPLDLAADARYRATGKRKTSVARVILKPGKGEYVVNGRALDVYFPRDTLQKQVRAPLETTGNQDRMDVVAKIHGGGVAAQAGALRHGIARSLVEADPNLRGELKRRGFLTRDARVKERKKAGLKKARKRPQFSKR
jgi:small subunit ribosomal protein S9